MSLRSLRSAVSMTDAGQQLVGVDDQGVDPPLLPPGRQVPTCSRGDQIDYWCRVTPAAISTM
jgi:hypothetical protein